MLFKKKKQFTMNPALANEALQNVFDTCEKAPNSTPLEKLIQNEELNIGPYNRLIIIASVLLLLHFAVPLTVVPFSGFLEHQFAPKAVELVNDYVEDDVIYLQLSGDNILYDEAYLVKADGTVVPVLSYDKKHGFVSFPYYSDSESNIYIPVKDAAPFHLLLSPQ